MPYYQQVMNIIERERERVRGRERERQSQLKGTHGKRQSKNDKAAKTKIVHIYYETYPVHVAMNSIVSVCM